MKNLLLTVAAHLIFLFSHPTLCTAQKTDPRDKIAVLQLDSKGFALDPVQMGNLARIELDKLGLFEVMDPYDVNYLLEKEQITVQNCYGKLCVVDIGRKLKADKMLTGGVELLGENIVITLRLIDVATATVEKSQVMEFLNLKNQIQPMLGLTLQQMFGLPSDENLRSKLTKRYDYESAVNVPDVARLNLSGPRMGITLFSGETAERFKAPERQGGLDASPVMFQFGGRVKAMAGAG
ncbi:MAG TPA: hypothetical protein PKL15_21405, partial [Saprospiraceae bacterium]|nr:hypothetical protein [Saprospiraceae bacterium]